MASIPLTLAALATSAVPALQVVGSRPHQVTGSGNFTSAVVLTDSGELLVRIPTNPQAEVQLSGELLGLAALSGGARESLPCQVPETLGLTRYRDTRAVVTTFISGDSVRASDITADALIIDSLSVVLSAIHVLPVRVVQQHGLPVRTADEVRTDAERIVERAFATHLVPETVYRSWRDLLAHPTLWDFEPCVVHGSFDADQLRVQDDMVTGLLGWDALSVGDPAHDFTWLFEASVETFESVFARYAAKRGVSGSSSVLERARFYHQLEVAKWLLHGIEMHDTEVVNDAMSMLDRLVDRMSIALPLTPTRIPLDEQAVADMLNDTPLSEVDQRSEAAEYESLDEDRMFEFEHDASGTEPLTAESVDALTAAESTPVPNQRADGDPTLGKS